MNFPRSRPRVTSRLEFCALPVPRRGERDWGGGDRLYCLTFNAWRNTLPGVIKSFRCDETERLFHREPSRKFRSIERSALRKLDMLDAANDLRILSALPGNRLERLRGDREGQYSIRINDQWRVCFAWREGDAYDVEITDHH